MPGAVRTLGALGLAWLLAASCLGSAPALALDESPPPLAPAAADRAAAADPAEVADTAEMADPGSAASAATSRVVTCRVQQPAFGFLDRAEAALYRTLCGTTLWFDGFFGEPTLYEGAGETYGRLSVGSFWDERNGLEPRVRLRARVALPALEHRLRLLVGLGDPDELVDGTADSYSERTVQSFTTERDDELLLGLGYSPSGDPRRGFDLEGGLRLELPLTPYAGVNYRWYEQLGEDWFVRMRLRGFWLGDEDGLGTSLTTNLDYAASRAVLLRWATFSRVTQATDDLEWRSRLTAFQRIGQDRAVSYALFVAGESGAEVPLQDYGLELRYRRRAFTPAFFVELAAGVSWPRGSVSETRELNPGAGVDFELHFGERGRRPR